MRVIALRAIKRFVESRPEYKDAREPALAWYRHVLKANWSSPAAVKRDFGNASILKDGRVVFNIAGRCYRRTTHLTFTETDYEDQTHSNQT
jgi:mRNA interferase HigB